MLRQKESYNLYPPLTVANVYLEKSYCVKHLVCILTVALPGMTTLTTYVAK